MLHTGVAAEPVWNRSGCTVWALSLRDQSPAHGRAVLDCRAWPQAFPPTQLKPERGPWAYPRNIDKRTRPRQVRRIIVPIWGLYSVSGSVTRTGTGTGVKNDVDQKFWTFVVLLTIISLLILWVSLQKPL